MQLMNPSFTSEIGRAKLRQPSFVETLKRLEVNCDHLESSSKTPKNLKRKQTEDGNQEDMDFVSANGNEEGDEYEEMEVDEEGVFRRVSLTEDPLTRPRILKGPEGMAQPQGWRIVDELDGKKRVNVIFRVDTVNVTFSHRPGENGILATWSFPAPSIRFLKNNWPRHSPPLDWSNPTVIQKVKNWVPLEWSTVIPCPLPHIPNLFSVERAKRLVHCSIPAGFNEERRAFAQMGDEDDGAEMEEEEKTE
jgi:hypothetical protein